MRGKLKNLYLVRVCIGLIPACAGKTGRLPENAYTWWAHPRVCGENCVSGMGIEADRGSSPRVRGKRLFQVAGHLYSRLIPACAGKTSLNAWTPWSKRAHPRVCGENHFSTSSNSTLTGSSPRVRGKLRREALSNDRCVLIPACAGKTLYGTDRRRRPKAHPRVCGENSLRRAARSHFIGSSPRVRGKRRPY